MFGIFYCFQYWSLPNYLSFKPRNLDLLLILYCSEQTRAAGERAPEWAILHLGPVAEEPWPHSPPGDKKGSVLGVWPLLGTENQGPGLKPHIQVMWRRPTIVHGEEGDLFVVECGHSSCSPRIVPGRNPVSAAPSSWSRNLRALILCVNLLQTS